MSYRFDNNERPPKEIQAITPKQIWELLVQNWWIYLVCLSIAIAIAFYINRNTKPVYAIKTSALIKSSKDVNSAVSEVLYGEELFGAKSVDLESEAYIMKSSTLISKTLKDLNFNVSYYSIVDGDVNEIYPDSPITLEFEGSNYIPYNYQILVIPLDSDTYSLSLETDSKLESIFKKDHNLRMFDNMTFKFGEYNTVNQFYFNVNKVDGATFNSPIMIRLHRYEIISRSYRNGLSVAPIAPESSILELKMNFKHQIKGITFLDKLVENYIANELAGKNETAAKTIDFINAQITLMSDSLDQVEGKLEDFKKSNSQITLSSEGSNYLELGQQLDTEKNQILLNQQYLQEVESYIGNDNIEDIVIPSSIGITDQGLNTSIQELVDLQLQATTVKSNNPLMAGYRQRIEALKNRVIENINSLKSSSNMALANVNSRISRLNSTVRNLPEAERQFINIQRKYNLSENLYLFLIEKKTEAGIAKASNTVDYRVIDLAEASMNPVAPRPMINYLFAVALGLGIPFLLLFLRLILNDKVGTKEELTSLTTIPYLGMVAKSNGVSNLLAGDNGRSIAADSFRTIRSNLRYLFSNPDNCTTYLLTSSISAEGKSFCANNLAYLFSNFGKRVVLINADMRKSEDYSDFDVKSSIGLSDYLAGLVSKEDIITSTKFPNLSLVVAGDIPPNPSELLLNGRFEKLLDYIRPRFDYLIIDTPPIGILPDGLELMEKCDVNIFVVRQNYSLKKFVTEVQELYDARKVQNLAILFNGVNLKKVGGYYKYYSKYSKQYYKLAKSK